MNDTKSLHKLADKLISLSKSRIKGEADVSSSTGWGTSVKFENDRLKSISSAQKSSVALRVINKSRIGLSGTTKVNTKEIKEVLADAIELSSFGKKVNFKLPKNNKKSKKPRNYDSKVDKLSVDKFVDIGKKVVAEVKSKEPGMMVNSVNFNKKSGESYFLNTNGVTDTDKYSGNSFSLEISKIKQGDFFQLYKGKSSVKADINWMKVTSELLDMARWGRKVSKIKSGTYPVVFAPEAVDDLLGFLLTSLNGKSVNEKSSKFEGKLGSKLFDKRLTIADDPTLNYYPGSYRLDDEGVQGKKHVLIKNGAINKFIYDLYEGSRAGDESTGNGERSGLFGHSSPSPSNIIVSPGTKSYKSLVRDIKEGILAYEFLGSGQNNPYNGDFQLGLYMGFKIENGEVVGRLKSTSIAGNAFDLLKDKLMWLSKDTKRMGSLNAPYICLDDVVVVSK